MAEEEDSFPPETQKSPKEFLFREFGQLSFEETAEEISNQPKYRTSLLAVANQYGIVFSGSVDGFKVFSTTSLLTAATNGTKNVAALVSVVLRAAPCWLAVSSDNMTLAVCSSSEKGLQVLFFDVRNLMNKNKPTKTPFLLFLIDKSPDLSVVDLQWNPGSEMAGHLAICVSNGAFHVLSIKQTLEEIAKKPADFNALSVCWSPKGKQMMIGKRDGSIQQFTPTMEIRRVVPVCSFVDRKVQASNVTWLSTLQVAVTYTVPPDDDGESALPSGGPSVFIASLPPSKEQNKSISWKNFEDPCYSADSPRPTQYYSLFLEKWELFILGSSNAADTAVIGKDKSRGAWEIWDLDDSCRAQLPITSDIDPSPLGGAVITTATDKIRLDDSRECDAMPILCLLSTHHQLCLYHIINLQGGYPSLITQLKELSVEGERTLVPPMARAENQSTGTPGVKAKLSGKQSVLVTTSTPKFVMSGRTPTPNESLQMSPLVPVGVEPKKVAPLAQKALLSSFTQQSEASKIPNQAAESKVFEVKEIKPDTPRQKPLTRTASLKQGGTPTSGNLEQMGKRTLVADDRFKGSPIPTTPVEHDLKRRPVLNKARDRLNSYSGPDGDSLAESLSNEVKDFEVELNNFFAEFRSLENEVSSLGGSEQKNVLKQEVESMLEFRDEIARTTSEQHEEVKTIRTVSIEAFAAVQQAETRRQRSNNSAYRDALVSRPLDMADQRKMLEIRTLHQYVRNSIRDADAALNDQWKVFRDKSTPSSGKSKRRVEMEERNSILKAISNQTKILHQQELQITLLGQELDNLRLLNTACSPANLSTYNKTRGNAPTRCSSDLSMMANSLIRDKRNMTQNDPNLTSHPPKISAKKKSQLSHLLSTRKTTPVRSSISANRSRIMAPTLNLSKHIASRTISIDSKHSNLTSDFSTEYSDTSSPGTYEGDSRSLSANNDLENKQSKPLYFGAENQQMSKPAAPTLFQPFLDSVPSVPVEPLPRGRSTLTYGGPSSVQYPAESSRVEIHHKEAASNLNNPPMVVNIKEIKEPTESNIPRFSSKFEAEADVPPGAAAEVQKVLNTVLAETQQKPTNPAILNANLNTNKVLSDRSQPPGGAPKPVLPGLASKLMFPSSSPTKMGSTGNLFSPLTGMKSGSLSDVSAVTKQLPLSFTAPESFGAKSVIPINKSGNTDVNQTNKSSNTGNKSPFVMSPFGNLAVKSGVSPQTNQESLESKPEAKTIHTKSSSLSFESPGEKLSSVMRSSSASAAFFKAQAAASRNTSAATSQSTSKESVSSDPGSFILGESPSGGQTSGVRPSGGANQPFQLGGTKPLGVGKDSPQGPAKAPSQLSALLSTPAGVKEVPLGTTSAQKSFSLNVAIEDKNKPVDVVKDQPAKPVFGVKPFTEEPTSKSGFSFTLPTTSSFGTTASTTSSFGAPAQTSSSFGAPALTTSTFGAPASTTSSFGAVASTTSTFGTPASTTSTFGTPASTTSTFGTPASTTSSFGAPASTTSSFAAPASITSSFGALASTTSSFGAPASTASSFGAPASTTSSFGAVASTTSSFGAVALSTSSFGAPASSTSSLDTTALTTSTFGAVASTTSSFGAVASTTSSLGTTTSTTSIFGAPASTTSTFGAPASTTSSFGAVSSTTSSFGTTASTTSTFSAPASTTSSFGAPASTTSTFGTPASTTSSFGAPASTTSTFGAPASTTSSFTSPFSGLFSTSKKETANTGGFGQPSAVGGSVFGSPQTEPEAIPVSISESTGYSVSNPSFGGGGFFSGLGSTPREASNANPFAASTQSSASTENKSLFGNTGSFSTFGQQPAFGKPSVFGSVTSQPQDNAFAKPAASGGGGFGTPSVFGGSAGFGAKPTFGSPPSFGGFGSAASPAFGATATPSDKPFGFSSFANTESLGFGALAANTGGGFGSGTTAGFGSGTTAGFGSGNTGGFGSGNTGGFGSGNTGGFASGNTGGFGSGNTAGFGSGNTGGFGSGNTGGFGSGNTGGFGSGNTGAFGSGNTGGFGSAASPSFGSTFGGASQPTAFGSQSQATDNKPSFSGWR